jgi:ribosomal protein S12 methylthiotransferase accessory factor YcaO
MLFEFISKDFSLCEIDDPESPVFLAAALPKREGVTGRKPRLPSGRGIWSGQAQVAAAAEAIELMSLLPGPGKRQPVQSQQPGGLHYCLAKHADSTEQIAIEAQRVYLDYAAVNDEPQIWDADSSGCAAGTSQQEALNRAVLELVERDALATWWYGRHWRQKLDLAAAIHNYPRLVAACETRDRTTVMLDISTDIAVYCIASISWDSSGKDVAIGASADTAFEAAALSALTEMFQTESSLRLADSFNTQHASLRNALSVESFPHIRGAEMNMSLPVAKVSVAPIDTLKAAGLEAYFVDLTLESSPLSVVRAFVPGLGGMGPNISTRRILDLRYKFQWPTDLVGDEVADSIDPF